MSLKEVEVVGVIQDVRDYDGDPCDKGVFLPQNQTDFMNGILGKRIAATS
jgi:hypothetical protein